MQDTDKFDPLTGPVNVIQLTIAHRSSTNTITITATSPYIEDPQDKVIIALRNMLVAYTAQITEPAVPGQVHPIWGEFTEEKPSQAPEAVRTPSPIIVER